MNSTWNMVQILNSNFVSCGPDCTVSEAARRMYAAGSGIIVIDTKDSIAGIWTEADALWVDLNDRNDLTRPIAEVMHSPVPTIVSVAPVEAAREQLRKGSLGVLLVTDESGRPLGILERSSLRQPDPSLGLSDRDSVARLIRGLPRTFAIDDPIATVIEQMRKCKSEAVVVSYPQSAYGVITQRDILRLLGRGDTRQSAGDSAQPLIVCAENTPLAQTLRLMLTHHTPYLGVLDDQKQILGIVSLASVLSEVEAINARHHDVHTADIPNPDERGQPATAHGLGRDLTRDKRSERLALTQRDLLAMLATGENIHNILDYLCVEIEELAPPGSMCSVLLMNPDGKTLRLGAAPNVAETLKNAFNNFPVGQCNASCGTAVFRGEQVIVEDIIENPLWDDYRDLALQHGFRACWSAPFKSQQGTILGTFAISHAVPRKPEEFDFELLKTGLSLASIIVEKQKADDELRLAAITFETNEGIFVTDDEGNILRVNQAFSRITGYSQQEVIGKNPRILQSGKQPNSFYDGFWNSLQQKGQWSGEMYNRWKNGEIHPIWQTITAVKKEDGAISHYVSTFSDMSEYKKAEAQIEQLAYYDPLTQLPNRRLLYDRLQQQLKLCRRHAEFGALLFLDLDDFKKINDSLGHHIGDQLLIEVATRLKSSIREQDTCARLGGDEFVILLSELGSESAEASANALAVARKIKSKLDQVYLLNRYKHYISSSIGVTLYPEKTDTVDDILRQGDTAMYRAKAAGRNHTVLFHHSMRQEADYRLILEKDLREALENDGLQLHYQAQFNSLNEVIGAEALIRWPHPHKGFVSPGEFIPIAEESGLISTLGDWIFDQVCQQLKSWLYRGIKTPHIAINISPRQFHQPGFISTIRDSISKAGIDPSRIILELTESLLIENINETIDKMNALKTMGFRFSIDDFGTGYSSLAYLKRLPLDQLKIDQSFIRDLDSDPHDAEIVKTIIAMTQNLTLDVIAEGVEEQSQVDFLLQNGCYAFQGYYFAKPAPAPDLEKMLTSSAP